MSIDVPLAEHHGPTTLISGSAGISVLSSGGHFIHCGEPMEYLRVPDVRVAVSTETPLQPFDDVLRCACGFQMDAPRA